MSARDELPPGCTADNSTGGRFPWRIRYHSGETSLSSYMHRHEIIEWAQARYDTEELATMRAAAERCAELEAALAKVTAERDALSAWGVHLEGKFQTVSSQRDDAMGDTDRAIASRDEARVLVQELCCSDEPDVIRDAIRDKARRFLGRWERATPTEAE